MAPRKAHQPRRYLDNEGRVNNPEYGSWKRSLRLRWINKYKTARGCDLCGYNLHAVALDWDHLDREDKEFMPSSRMITVDLKRLFREIRKCRLLCANCHRAETYNKGHFRNK